MANKSVLNDIIDAQAAAVVTLDAKNRGATADAVLAVTYGGSNRNYIEKLVTAAGVTVTYDGSDANMLAAFVAAVAALSTVP